MDFAPEKYASAVVKLGPARVKDVEETVEVCLMVAQEIVAKALQPVLEKLEELDRLKKNDRSNVAIIENLIARIAALEQTPAMKYVGVWTEGNSYAKSEFATHDGSMWACRRDNTTARPGTSPECWSLAVKRGKNAG